MMLSSAVSEHNLPLSLSLKPLQHILSIEYINQSHYQQMTHCISTTVWLTSLQLHNYTLETHQSHYNEVLLTKIIDYYSLTLFQTVI